MRAMARNVGPVMTERLCIIIQDVPSTKKTTLLSYLQNLALWARSQIKCLFININTRKGEKCRQAGFLRSAACAPQVQ